MSSRYQLLPPSMIVSPSSSSGASSRDGVGDERGRHHDPDVARALERADELLQRVRRRATPSASSAAIGVAVHVVGDALVAGRHEPAHHVGAHPPESDHAELHRRGRLLRGRVRRRVSLHRTKVATPGPGLSSRPVDPRELDRAVTGCAGAHQRLLATLHDLDDDAGTCFLAPARLVRRPRPHPSRSQRGREHPDAGGRESRRGRRDVRGRDGQPRRRHRSGRVAPGSRAGRRRARRPSTASSSSGRRCRPRGGTARA